MKAKRIAAPGLAATLALAALIATAACPGGRPSPESLFVAEPLTDEGQFTAGIEGPACDAAGFVYAVNFERQGTIGRVAPDGRGEVFAVLPEGGDDRRDGSPQLQIAPSYAHRRLPFPLAPRNRSASTSPKS